MNNANALRAANLFFILLNILGCHLVCIDRNIRHCSKFHLLDVFHDVHGIKIHNQKFQIKRKKCGKFLILWKQLNFMSHNLQNVIKNVF